jgi:serine/threonine-protein kinase
MSPEQMRAPRGVDARTDIWSIGAILYDLVSGRPPYVAETIPQLCTMMLEGDPAPLGSLRTDLNPQLEQVIARALARDVSQRWSSVAELAVALLPFGSRSSRLHVERAGRVLSAASREALSLLPPPESDADSLRPTGLSSSTPSPASPIRSRVPGTTPSGLASAPMRSVTPTEKTWENSRSRSRRIPMSGEGSTYHWVPVAALAALVLVGGMSWWLFSRKSDAPAPSPVASSSVLVSPVAASTHENPSADPASEPTAPAASSNAPASSASAMPSVAASAAPASSTGTVAALANAVTKPAMPAVAEVVNKPVDRVTPPRAPAPATSPAATGLTDFGGRRRRH